jgi:hypothetical protein
MLQIPFNWRFTTHTYQLPTAPLFSFPESIKLSMGFGPHHGSYLANHFLNYHVTNYVDNKLAEYKSKEKELDTAVNMGYYFIRLMNHHEYDSLWKHTSPLLEKYADKEQFMNMLKQRNANYRPTDSIQFKGRIVFNKIDDMAGDFYVIYYMASNNTNEQLTMIKTDDGYQLLGYHYALSSQQ